jgi:hypothetical protein
MNQTVPELDPGLVAWLADGPTSGPGEVLSSTLARARTTRQDRRPPWRIPTAMRSQVMSTLMKLAAVTAIVLAVAIATLPTTPTTQQPAAITAASPTTSPTPERAPVVHGWPGARANPAGLYSWTPGRLGWMHRTGGISMTFAVLDDERGALAEVAPRPAELERPITEQPKRIADLRIQSWVLHSAGDDIVVTITSGPDTPPSVIAEAEAVVRSIRVEPTGTEGGYRLIFELEDGWDSG